VNVLISSQDHGDGDAGVDGETPRGDDSENSEDVDAGIQPIVHSGSLGPVDSFTRSLMLGQEIWGGHIGSWEGNGADPWGSATLALGSPSLLSAAKSSGPSSPPPPFVSACCAFCTRKQTALPLQVKVSVAPRLIFMLPKSLESGPP